MFSNFAWSEMLIIAIVAILVVGPKDLPGMLRSIGKTIGSLKRMAGDFQRQFNDAIQDADMDELKNMTSSKGFAPLEDAKRSMEEFAQSMESPVNTEPEIEAPAVTPASTTKAAETETSAKPAAKKRASRKTAPKKPASANGSAGTAGTSKSKAAPKKPAATKRAAPKKAAAAKPAEEKTAT